MKLLATLLFACLAIVSFPAHKGAAAELDRAQVEQVIKDYILSHPEIIRDAIAALERQTAANEEKARQSGIKDNRNLLLASTHQAVFGNLKGDATIVEFFDYNCPYCRKAAGDVTALLQEDGNLRVVLKEWPILGPDSVEAAQVSIAARMQDPGTRFREFHERLLASRGRANKAAALAAAEAVGYDAKKIESDLASLEVKATIEEVTTLATALAITGTPTFVVGKQAVAGAVGIDAMRELVKKGRDDCKAQQLC